MTAGASGNNVTKTLQAFGVSLTDADGKLKSHEQQMLALAEGFNRARKSGQQYEMQNLLIRNGMGDMVVAIEDYAANLEGFKNGWCGRVRPTLFWRTRCRVKFI